jgi:hypothetical protein
MDFDQTWYILSPYESLEPNWFSRSKVKGCYTVKIWPGDIDLWSWKSIGFQTLLRTTHVPSLVKIHWRMLILECSQGCYAVKILPCDLWPMILKINRVPDSPKDYVCTKFGQNPLNILSPYESLEPNWFSRSKVKVTGSNFYCITSLWTL